MNAMRYQIPEKLPLETLLDPLLEASLFISRFDESLKNSPLRELLLQRLLFGEALACQLAQGDLVHMEDLVLLDARVYAGKPAATLSSTLYTLKTWRRALQADPLEILRSRQPGEVPVNDEARASDPGPLKEANPCDPDRLQAWQAVVQRTNKLPPLLAAAIVWDAWLTLLPDSGGAWRASLLAALVLRARGATIAFLLPLDTGRRHATYRRREGESQEARIRGFLSWAVSGVTHAQKELRKLVSAHSMLRFKITGHRKHAKLPELVGLFLTRPIVSIPLASAALRVSKQSALKMFPRLGAHIREVTGRARYRAWTLN